ncbi:hypothetical protein SLA2020_353250 [Shorea laevis]
MAMTVESSLGLLSCSQLVYCYRFWLVRYVITGSQCFQASSDVCGGANALFILWSWIDAAKFLTGASTVGSIAIPIILRHADMIETGGMFLEFTSFFIFVCTVLCFHHASLEDGW